MFKVNEYKLVVVNNKLVKLPVIKGAKGGGSSHTPVEAKETGRSRQQMDIIEIISEGEIWGLKDDMKSIYFDKTPIQNDDNSFNFKNVIFNGASGTQDQGVMRGFDNVQNEIAVGVEVKYGKGITRRITNKNITSLRFTIGVKALSKTEDNGDINPTSVTFKLTVGDRTYTESINGKYTAGTYMRMVEIRNLPKPPFNIKVERLTADSTTTKLQNATIWSSYTEVIEEKFAYPNTAVMGISLDSEYFSSLPKRNYLVRGIMVKIPDIYDGFTRKYSSDFWNGDFKIGWTNNPAWIFYDLVTNERYGMGRTLRDFGVDKFQLFAIAKYCDEIVPDGYGGTEPRMTCNCWIIEQKQAHEILSSLASVFRAMPVWNGQQLTAVQDRVQDPVWLYNNANVVDGKFIRSRSARKSRHNVIQVEYADKDDFYQQAIEEVSDDVSIRRFGRNVKKVTAFGCTSRGQAYRTGRWILETEKLETETITFSVGREGLMHLPYDIIEVADNQYAGTDIGGRIISANNNTVILDRPLSVEEFEAKTSNWYLTYLTKTGRLRRLIIQEIDNENNKLVRLSDVIGEIPEYAVWGLETDYVQKGLYRCISIKENTEDGTYEITALQHVPEKEDIVVNGTHFDPKPQTRYSTIDDIQTHYDGKKLIVTGIVSKSTNTGTGELTYDIKITKNGSVISNKLGQKTAEYSTDDLENGDYVVEIIMKDGQGRIISRSNKSFTIDKPPAVTGITVNSGISSIFLEWDYINEITDTEIWASKTNDLDTAEIKTKINGRMYQFNCGSEETWYFWLRNVRGINIGSFGSPFGIKGVSKSDLKDLENLEQKIVDNVIDVALPARKLELTKVITTLPNKTEYQNAKIIYVEDEGENYTWNGTEYVGQVRTIEASAIEGILDPSQLPAIPKSKIDGKFTDAEIESINVNKLVGVIPENQLAPIPTTKLTGTINANQISANSIGANHIIGNSITGDKIRANSISGDKLTANSITSNLIASQAIQATHIKSGTITATQIASNTITGNLLRAGSITGDKLAVNSIDSGVIRSGAIRTDHLQSGSISVDKLAIGLGGNLLVNPILANNGYNWGRSENSSIGTSISYSFRNKDTGGDWHAKDTLPTENVLVMHLNTTSDGEQFGYADPLFTKVRLVPNRWYIFSCYANLYRVDGYLLVEKRNNDGTSAVSTIGINRQPLNPNGSAISAIGEMSRYFLKFQAPDTGWVSLRFRCDGTTTGGYPDCYIARPMLEECTEYATMPSVWQNAGVTSIHGGSIQTRTITAQQIQANSITGNEIAANSITGDKIVARSISTDKIRAGTLSAISANLGSITAGSIRIGTLNGANGTLFELQSNGGFRLISRDGSGGIELSSSSRALTVWDGPHEVVRVGKLS